MLHEIKLPQNIEYIILMLCYSGEKFAFGHMYVRPHETFHEPSRKFYPNEVCCMYKYCKSGNVHVTFIS